MSTTKERGDFNCQGIGPCELVWNQCPGTLVLVQKLDLPLSHIGHIVNGRCIIYNVVVVVIDENYPVFMAITTSFAHQYKLYGKGT